MFISHKKRFGQHFLHDQNILEQMEYVIAPKKTDYIVEIGPGEGALTEHVAEQVEKYTALEIDRDLVPLLQKKYQQQKNFRVIETDALQFQFASLTNAQHPQLRIIGNLPYNISTPLLFHLFETKEEIIDMHFLLQKEVVDRLTAQPGNKTYGRLSVMAQYFSDMMALFTVQPEAFQPPPKVDSAFIRIIPKTPKLPARNMKVFSDLVRDAFNLRRKNLRNALRAYISAESLLKLNIDPLLRPEDLTIDDFVRISNNVSLT